MSVFKKENTLKSSDDSTKRWCRVVRILCCTVLLFALYCPAFIVYADTTTPTASPDAIVDEMNAFAFEHYKVICRICIPMAIISFASCGYKFLGAIFMGNYTSGGGDMQKAQKQFVMTILAVLFLLLLPTIFGGAVDFFKESAWTP